ncbi:MAG: hypothetical protein HQK59_06930 [Deltaproteobacteria bacterium]|nr:hypothetical protein [Deltaproteobacteria bacterium]
MKTYNLTELVDITDGGEYVLGRADLNTHACYLVYGRLKPGETNRSIKPGPGHEEILCLVKGTAEAVAADGMVKLATGEALHLRGEEELFLQNTGTEEVIYILAGGHSPDSGHHH